MVSAFHGVFPPKNARPFVTYGGKNARRGGPCVGASPFTTSLSGASIFRSFAPVGAAARKRAALRVNAPAGTEKLTKQPAPASCPSRAVRSGGGGAKKGRCPRAESTGRCGLRPCSVYRAGQPNRRARRRRPSAELIGRVPPAGKRQRSASRGRLRSQTVSIRPQTRRFRSCHGHLSGCRPCTGSCNG